MTNTTRADLDRIYRNKNTQKWGHGSASFRRFCSFVTRDPVARSTTFARGTSFRPRERGHSQRDRRAGCGLVVYSWSARTLHSQRDRRADCGLVVYSWSARTLVLIARHVHNVVTVGQSDNRNKKMALIDLRVIYRLGAELPEL
nr:MAG: hypothetical protein [Apis mellifera filamentous virus]